MHDVHDVIAGCIDSAGISGVETKLIDGGVQYTIGNHASRVVQSGHWFYVDNVLFPDAEDGSEVTTNPNARRFVDAENAATTVMVFLFEGYVSVLVKGEMDWLES